MPREVPVLSPVNALPFLPPKDGLVLDIEGLLSIVGQLVGTMFAEAQAILMVDETLIPIETKIFPVVEPLLHLGRMYEELQVPLLKFALAEQEVPRCHLIAEGFPDLADAEGNLHARGFEDIIVVQVDVLARLTAQVGLHFV